MEAFDTCAKYYSTKNFNVYLYDINSAIQGLKIVKTFKCSNDDDVKGCLRFFYQYGILKFITKSVPIFFVLYNVTVFLCSFKIYLISVHTF